MGLWVRAHATVKNMGSMGDSDAEKGGLLSLTYASPPEWDCPPPPPGKLQQSVHFQSHNASEKDNQRNIMDQQYSFYKVGSVTLEQLMDLTWRSVQL